MTILRLHPITRLCVLGALLLTTAITLQITPHVRAAGVTYGFGDVFVGVGLGHISHLSPTGALLDTLNTGSGHEDTGMCFDASGDLYATNFGGSPTTMTKFDNQGNVLTFPWGGPFSVNPESCVVDNAGNIYVGEVDGSDLIRKFDLSGNLLATFNPTKGLRGIDWMDLAADQCTMYYTSEDSIISRFNVCTNSQLPDFVTGLPAPCYALRIRSGGDVLVACQTQVIHLDPAGNRLQTYTLGTAETLFALNIDPDTTSFWTAGYTSGHVYKVDIASGTVLLTLTVPFSVSIAGLAIFGEQTVGCTNCALTPTPSPIQSPGTSTATPLPSSTATPSTIPTPADTSTLTPIPSPSATNTSSVPTATETEVPRTRTATPTHTPRTTAVPTQTSTPTPSATPTTQATNTATTPATATGTPTASATSTPVAQLSANPVQGIVSTTVTLTGTSFSPAEVVRVSWDSMTATVLLTRTTSATGTFTGTIHVPLTTAGTHALVAVGQSSGRSASASFMVRPAILLTPSSGTAGSSTVMQGAGFGPRETVQAHWNSPTGQLLGTTTTTNVGTFTGRTAITLTIPISPTGSYRVFAVGQTSHASAAAAFTIR